MFATKFLPHSLSPRKQCQYLKLIVYSNILPYFQSSSFDHESKPRTGLAWRQWQHWCGRFPFGSATPTVETAMGLRWISLKCGGLSSSVTGSAMGLSLFFSFFLRFRLLLCSVWFLLLGFVFVFCFLHFFLELHGLRALDWAGQLGQGGPNQFAKGGPKGAQVFFFENFTY